MGYDELHAPIIMLYSTPSSRYGQYRGQANVMGRFFDSESGDFDDDDMEDDDTLEMELTPDQMRLLAEAAVESRAGEDGDAAGPGSAATLPTATPATPTQTVLANWTPPTRIPKAPAAADPTPAAAHRAASDGGNPSQTAPVSSAPEIVITVAIGPAVVRAVPVTRPSASSRAPIVIEHAPVKLKPVKPPEPAEKQQPKHLHSQLRGALVAGVVAIAAFLSTIAYVAVTKARPSEVPVFTVPQLPRETSPVPAPAVVAEPVRFANPFDSTEVFEFPPGTTETQAHDAVAAILLQRGEARFTQAEAAQRRVRKAAQQRLAAASTKLAQRD